MIADPLTRIMDHPHAFRLQDGGAQQLMGSLLMSLAMPMLVIFARHRHRGRARPRRSASAAVDRREIKPDLAKLSPMKGLQRMFGMQGWVNLLKSFLKMAAITGAMIYAVWPEATAISESGRLDPAGLLAMTQVIAGRLLLAAIIVVGLIAGDGLHLSALDLHAAHAHVAQGRARRGQAAGRRSAHPRPPAPDPPRAVAQAHDAERAEVHRRHHQPDPLLGRVAL
jgi:flagellar biosynthesis protein FlhB